MNAKLFPKLIKKSFDLADIIPHGFKKHFSYIVKKGNILSIGWNVNKTHPMSWRHGYEFPFIHSEVSALRNLQYPPTILDKCELVNVRIGSRPARPMISRPCSDCLRLLSAFAFREVWYTDEDGKFQCL